VQALIDSDILLYRMAWVCQKTHYTHKDTGEFFDGIKKAKDWFKEYGGYNKEQHGSIRGWLATVWNSEDWDIVEEIEPWSACKHQIDNIMGQIQEDTKAEDYECYLTAKPLFRDHLATLDVYKAGRPPPPHWRDKARAYFAKSYHAVEKPLLEADDLLGLNQTEDTCIVTNDKDLQMISGRHYNPITREKTKVSQVEADNNFYSQLISGDRATDNIRGIDTMGPKRSMEIVTLMGEDRKGLVEEIEAMYENQYPGMGKDAMVETARLVYILRAGDTIDKGQWRELLFLV